MVAFAACEALPSSTVGGTILSCAVIVVYLYDVHDVIACFYSVVVTVSYVVY